MFLGIDSLLVNITACTVRLPPEEFVSWIMWTIMRISFFPPFSDDKCHICSDSYQCKVKTHFSGMFVHPWFFRYWEVFYVLQFEWFKSKQLVIRKMSADERFSAFFMSVNEWIYCIFQLGNTNDTNFGMGISFASSDFITNCLESLEQKFSATRISPKCFISFNSLPKFFSQHIFVVSKVQSI